ncbi:MAG: ubiquinone/menaquinone biosynthesis methyltransferase [Candidatus Aminicenantales bacterium]
MEKRERAIADLFGRVAPTYQLVNHVFTFGLDFLWRRKAAQKALQAGGSIWVDVCSGTGDMAKNLARRSPEKTVVLAIDFSWPMLSRMDNKRNYFLPVQANSRQLPLADGTADLVTISFATRNLYHSREAVLACFREFYRVLRPGGFFLNLETSQPESLLLRRLLHEYVKIVVKPVGSLISGYSPPYAYLAHTIPRFLSARELADLLVEAGFLRVEVFPLSGGIVAIHLAHK